MPMKYPAHPGKIVRYECLEHFGLTVTKTAEILGVNRQTISKLINCRSGVSPEMAIRLSKAFGGTPEVWLRMQMAYDMAKIRDEADHIHVKPYRMTGPDRGELHT
jgi:addiction module HigA family antidote